jgi:VWFA-related protein
MSFDDKIRFLTPQPTNDRNALRYAIRQTRPGSGTRLYDAVDKVINEHLNHVEGRKAIVLFTDGVDTTSKKARYEDNVRDAEELDALIYPIEFDTYSDMSVWGPGGGQSSGSVMIDILGTIFGGGNSRGNHGGRGGGGGGGWPGGGGGGAGDSREEYERGDRYLHDLARVTGARLYNADQNLDVAFRSVAEELRRQYSLGYYPRRTPQPGERRSIRVRVNRPELAVRARESYVFKPGATNASQGGSQSPSQKPPVLKKDLSGTF